jgi:3-hydroxyisobutyrate dehydrogenase
VSGSRGPAEAGKLVAMVAGDERGIDQLEPLSRTCAARRPHGRGSQRNGLQDVREPVPHRFGCRPAGAARMACELGVEPAAFTQVMVEGPLGSEVVRAKLANDDEP